MSHLCVVRVLDYSLLKNEPPPRADFQLASLVPVHPKGSYRIQTQITTRCACTSRSVLLENKQIKGGRSPERESSHIRNMARTKRRTRDRKRAEHRAKSTPQGLTTTERSFLPSDAEVNSAIEGRAPKPTSPRSLNASAKAREQVAIDLCVASRCQILSMILNGSCQMLRHARQ